MQIHRGFSLAQMRRAPIWLAALALLLGLFQIPARAQEGPEPLLIPMGGGYSDLYRGYSEAVVARAQNGAVKILVLPLPYATNPESITEAERADNLLAAEERRYQIEEACQRSAPEGVVCSAVLAPIFVRADALDPAALDYFTPDLTAIFILGGDQTIAMRVIAGTPVETAMQEAYARGVIIGGTSAGCGMQSASMLAGYNTNYADGNALFFGSADVWHSAEQHGLLFGLQDAILDQHFFQRGRIGRLLSAISLPGVPHVGVGVDAYTGLLAPGGKRLEGAFGLYVTSIFDAQTYHAADAVQYVSVPGSDLPMLSLRNVLVNLLPEGDFSYDLDTRQFTRFGGATENLAAAERLERNFEALQLPQGAGALLLAGGIDRSLSADHPVLKRFVELSGGESANILVIAVGYSSESAAQRAADKYAAALGVPAQTLIVSKDAEEAATLPEGITGILLIGRDQSLVPAAALPDLKSAWLSGVPVMADGAGSALLGAFYSAHGPVPESGEENEQAVQASFLLGRTDLAPGLGLLNLTIEPDLISNNRWGRLFSLAYNHPELLSLGLSADTALEINGAEARAWGSNAIITLDLRTATLALGDNQGFGIANGLLDVFAPGEVVWPALADANAVLTPPPTPILPTPAPTQTPPPPPTATAEPIATPTEAPTAAPTATPTQAAASPTAPAVQPAPQPALSWALVGLLAAVLLIAAVLLLRRIRRQE